MRVALVFGGVSSEHGVSCLTAGGVSRAHRPGPVRGARRRHHPDGPVGPRRRRDAAGARGRRRPAARAQRGRRRRGADAHGRRQPSSRCATTSARRRPPLGLSWLGPVDVALPAARAVRRGRHHPGPVRDDGHPLRRRRRAGQRGRHGQALHEARARAPRACRSEPTSRSPRAEWARDRAACLDAVAALRYPVFVKPARGGSSLGITKVDDRRRARGGDRVRPAVRPEGRSSRRGSSTRASSSAACCPTSTAAGRRPARSPRSGCTARPGSTTSRPSTCPRSRSTWTCPPTSTPPSPTRSGSWPCGRSRRSAARAWPGSTSS